MNPPTVFSKRRRLLSGEVGFCRSGFQSDAVHCDDRMLMLFARFGRRIHEPHGRQWFFRRVVVGHLLEQRPAESAL